jgi:type II restriction enzyme
MSNFQTLITTLQPSIFTWSYFCDFKKIKNNVNQVEDALNLLNWIIGKENIEQEFIDKLETYPFIREVLPILIATRKEKLKEFQILTDVKNLISQKQLDLFDKNKPLDEERMLIFFKETGLKDLFKNQNIKNLVDYVFWVETWLDSNARKNRTGELMENIVEEFIKDFCNKKWYEYKRQATVWTIKEAWNVEIQIDKNDRRFDFAIFDWKKVFLVEVNYYGWWWSKLKSVAWEFSKLYDFFKNQWVKLIWITDWKWWLTAKRPLEEAYNAMEWNIYNLEMLKDGILDKLIK